MHSKRRYSRTMFTALIVCLVVAGSALGVLRWRIQSSLDDWCATAQAAHPHPGDDVAALMAYVQSDQHSLRKRNRAVWALGQARDPRALPALEPFATGGPCNHDRQLCQRELEKAIALCKTETPNLLQIRTPQRRGGVNKATDRCG